MNISCSICAEVFRGPDAQNLHVIQCGHVFHKNCLSKWLERRDTCPECRSKTTNSSVLRLFVNIVDSSYSVNGDDPIDLVGLQSENDHLKFRLIEKDGIIKSKEETLNRLQDENKKLTHGQFQSRTVIQKLEQRQEQHNLLTIAQNDQIKALKFQLSEIDQLREKLKAANEKNRMAELVQHLILGSQHETEALLKEGRSVTELATLVTSLKRELQNSTAKRIHMRSNVEELTKQLKSCKEEKLKLEEKCSILESKLFQVESNSGNQNNSAERLNSTDLTDTEKESLTEQQPAKRKFGEHLSLPRKVTKLETGRNVSPSMCIKASSIAGLSPLFKRTKSADLHKLSPLNNEKTETFSILKKPRLIQHPTRLRSIKPNKLPALSSIDSAPFTLDASHPSRDVPSTSLGSRLMNLDNRFRLGSLSKPN